MALSTAFADNGQNHIWPHRMLWYAATGAINPGTNTIIDITSTTKFALPLITNQTHTIDYAELWLIAGTSGDVTVRIETSGSTDGMPSGTLAHANLTDTQVGVGGSTGKVTFDFTNTSLSAGRYWMVISTTSSDTNLATSDYVKNVGWNRYRTPRYWDGTDWDASYVYAIHGAVFNADGEPVYNNLCHHTPPPLLGLNSANIMDTLENPDSRGVGIKAKYSGYVNCIYVAPGVVSSADRSFVMNIINKSDLTTKLVSEVEIFERTYGGLYNICPVPVERFEVTAGDTYYIYFRAGSQATTTQGMALYRVEIVGGWDASGNELYRVGEGMTSGDHFAVHSHDPVVEGGVGTWTEETDYTYSVAFGYSQYDYATGEESTIVTAGGGLI